MFDLPRDHDDAGVGESREQRLRGPEFHRHTQMATPRLPGTEQQPVVGDGDRNGVDHLREAELRRLRKIRLRERQFHGERAAVGRNRRHGDGASHRLDEAANDRQSKPHATGVPRRRLLHLTEIVEDARLLRLRYATARVLHHDPETTTVGHARGNRDVPRRREFQRIGQQVANDLRQA